MNETGQEALQSRKQTVKVEDIINFTRSLNKRPRLNAYSKDHIHFNRLVVVSNRLPVTMNMDGAGELQVKPSSGGLVTALSPVLRDTMGLWVGWTEQVRSWAARLNRFYFLKKNWMATTWDSLIRLYGHFSTISRSPAN